MVVADNVSLIPMTRTFLFLCVKIYINSVSNMLHIGLCLVKYNTTRVVVLISCSTAEASKKVV